MEESKRTGCIYLYPKSYTPELPLAVGMYWNDSSVISRGRGEYYCSTGLNDWIQTGKVLARLANTHDYEKIGQGRLTNDALIAMSATRLGITVITANARDFMRLAEFRPFQWKVHDFRGS